ncbi:hypothetical protein FOZ62_020096 [Perkinsus olseni]|uniref:Uncharacterized protein n=1 Tax=Perkinsus olseni TaxID=32597 RepID=A0A7J6S5M5_PEROL|nr:hypothetical protein FOZ62_020096 [Perkinsus olseni]
MSRLLTLLTVAFTSGAAPFPPSRVYFSLDDHRFPILTTKWTFTPYVRAIGGTVNIDVVYTTPTIPDENSAIYHTGEIPYAYDGDRDTMKLDTSSGNFIAFANKFGFNREPEDWEKIRYDPFDDRLTMLFGYNCYNIYKYWGPQSGASTR